MVVVRSGGTSIEYSNCYAMGVPETLKKTVFKKKKKGNKENQSEIDIKTSKQRIKTKKNTLPPAPQKPKPANQNKTKTPTGYYQPINHVIFLRQWDLGVVLLKLGEKTFFQPRA